MLMIGSEAKPPALGNFYYSPLRLRPAFEPQIHSVLPVNPETSLKRRQKKDSTLDLEMDLRPIDPRHSAHKTDIHNEDPSEEDSPLTKVTRAGDDDDNDDDPKPKKKKKKKKHHKSKNKKKDRFNKALEKLCRKMRISYFFVFLGVFALLICVLALYLRNRLVACFKRFWPFNKKNKKSKKDMFDVEGGDSPFLSRRSSKSKKKGDASRTVDTGVPDSRTSLNKSQDENGKIGCSPCSRKKKKKGKKQRK